MVVVVGVLLPILIGLSRIALDVHHPTDVLGGWLAGIAFVALAATLISITHAMERAPPATRLPRRRIRPSPSDPSSDA